MLHCEYPNRTSNVPQSAPIGSHISFAFISVPGGKIARLYRRASEF